jgi:hypothetical protein
MNYVVKNGGFFTIREEDNMRKETIVWLQDNQNLRADVIHSFQSDVRLENEALPDAIAANPTLLSDMAKELVCLAIRQDAPEGVVEDLMVPVRAMTKGAKELSKSVYLTQVLRSLHGLRDAYELEPVLEKALAEATDDLDRSKLQSMLETVQKSPVSDNFSNFDSLLPKSTELSPSCAPCCFLGCIICLEGCFICCVIGCLVC